MNSVNQATVACIIANMPSDTEESMTGLQNRNKQQMSGQVVTMKNLVMKMGCMMMENG